MSDQRFVSIAVAAALYLLASVLFGPSPSAPRESPGASPARPAGLRVVGYYVDEASYRSMVEHASRLDAVAIWAWSVDPSGALRAATDPLALVRAVQAAKSLGLEAYAMVHNYAQDTFDRGAVHGLLSSPSARERAVEEIAARARESGVSGVNLDFENVPPGDRAALSEFVRALAERLHRDDRRLTVAVPAATSDAPGNAATGAFDYAALGRYADEVWLMTYDEHYRTGPPGPVASLPWVERVVRFAASRIPSRKVLLGLPVYGYEWERSGQGRGLTYEQALGRLARYEASLRWHPVYKVPYFVSGSRQVWFENRYSAGYKLQLVFRYGLGGVAIWRLGQEDPAIWELPGMGSR